jgi:hypothetical protein
MLVARAAGSMVHGRPGELPGDAKEAIDAGDDGHRLRKQRPGPCGRAWTLGVDA